METLNGITNKTTADTVIKEIELYKPNRDCLKLKYKKETSIDINVYSDNERIKVSDKLTNENLPVPESAVNIENYRKKLKNLFNKTIHSADMRRCLKKREAGKTYVDIASEEEVSIITIRNAIKKGALKIKYNTDGTLLPEDLQKITKLSQVLGIKEKLLIRTVLKCPQLLSRKPETLLKNLEESAKTFNIHLAEFAKAALNYPSLFYQKPETLLKNIEESAKIFDVTTSQFMSAALKFPELMYRKPETLLKMQNNPQKL